MKYHKLILLFTFYLFINLSVKSQDKLYLTDFKNDQIFRCNIDGSELENLNFDTEFAHPEDIEIDQLNQKIYWTDYINDIGWIKKANLDGSNIESISFPDGKPRKLWLDTDNQLIYWTDDKLNKIRKSNTDLENIETLPISSLLNGVLGIAVDTENEVIYWSEYVENKLWKANLDGSDPLLLYASRAGNIKLSEDKQTIFCNDNAEGVIYKINIDGSNRVDLITGLDNVNAFELDYANNIYWEENQVNNGNFDDICLKRANLNDLIPEVLITSVDEHSFLGIKYYIGEKPLSVYSNEANSILVFPNPFKDRIYVNGLLGESEYKIYGLHGNLIYSGLAETTIDLDATNLVAGEYVLMIKNNEQWVYKTLLKL